MLIVGSAKQSIQVSCVLFLFTELRMKLLIDLIFLMSLFPFDMLNNLMDLLRPMIFGGKNWTAHE